MRCWDGVKGMHNEPIYFYSFLYLIILLTVSAVAVIIFCALIRRREHFLAWVLILSVISADLIVYGYQALQFVTQTRTGIKFNEKKEPFSLPVNRQERFYFDDLRFRYFRPALYHQFTAFDLSTLDYFTLTHNTGVSPSLILNQILDATFPFQTEVMKLSVIEFTRLGRVGYDSWTDSQRLAYLGVLETALQDILLQHNFYSLFIGTEELTSNIEKNIKFGYLRVLSKIGAGWNKERYETINQLEQLFELKLNIKPELASGISGNSEPGFNSFFQGLLKDQAHLYREMTVADYLVGFWYRYHLRDVNTFVRFKDYDRIANLYEKPVLTPNISAIRSRIRKDFAVGEPIIRFFPYTKILNPDQYYQKLSRGLITDDDLYLETRVGEKHASEQNNGQRDYAFSYQVISYDPNRLELFYKVNSPGYLYFSDGYDRYWKASVNGFNAQIYKANGAFKAIEIPTGSGKVEFVYDPVFFKIALWIYYITAITCLSFLIFKPILSPKPKV